MYYFTSDIHFCDEPTLKLDMRPFKNSKHFDNYVIKTWNKQTTKDDTIFVIGDFVDCDGKESISWQKSILYVKKLKAKVVLIIGNNEERVIKHFFNNNFEDFKNFCKQVGFADVYKNLRLEMLNQTFYLTHKPIDCKKDMINLFGHIHRSCGIFKPFGLNVGCDLNHFRLYSENDIKHLLNMKQNFWDKDKNVYLFEL